ncbi:MAG: transposase [Chloroflexi bacterium]|nr:transposase [Chloroflexota bacterium]
MNTAPLQFLQAFRQKLLGIFPRRADALFELIDALLLTLDPRSPVELSLSPAFRRRFCMVYDALRHGQVDPELAHQLLASAEPTDALEVAGYAVYALDSTVHPHEDAETLADRGKVYSASKEGAVAGHQYSWLGRVIAQGQSWFAPRDVERIATSTTPAGVAAEQVKRLALTLATSMMAVIVADSHYAKKVFLTAFVNLPNLFILVRLACNRVLYGPPPVVTGSRRRGRPRVHGDKFRLAL